MPKLFQDQSGSLPLAPLLLITLFAITTFLIAQRLQTERQELRGRAFSTCGELTSSLACGDTPGCSWQIVNHGICSGTPPCQSGCSTRDEQADCLSTWVDFQCTNDHPGCIIQTTTTTTSRNCTDFNTNETACNNTSGCTPQYSTCSSLVYGVCPTGCTLVPGTARCTGASWCSGKSETSCNQDPDCEWIPGTSPSCTGQHYTNSCLGNYDSVSISEQCSGTYATGAQECSGSYPIYGCTGNPTVFPSPLPSPTPVTYTCNDRTGTCSQDTTGHGSFSSLSFCQANCLATGPTPTPSPLTSCEENGGKCVVDSNTCTQEDGKEVTNPLPYSCAVSEKCMPEAAICSLPTATLPLCRNEFNCTSSGFPDGAYRCLTDEVSSQPGVELACCPIGKILDKDKNECIVSSGGMTDTQPKLLEPLPAGSSPPVFTGSKPCSKDKDCAKNEICLSTPYGSACTPKTTACGQDGNVCCANDTCGKHLVCFNKVCTGGCGVEGSIPCSGNVCEKGYELDKNQAFPVCKRLPKVTVEKGKVVNNCVPTAYEWEIHRKLTDKLKLLGDTGMCYATAIISSIIIQTSPQSPTPANQEKDTKLESRVERQKSEVAQTDATVIEKAGEKYQKPPVVAENPPESVEQLPCESNCPAEAGDNPKPHPTDLAGCTLAKGCWTGTNCKLYHEVTLDGYICCAENELGSLNKTYVHFEKGTTAEACRPPDNRPYTVCDPQAGKCPERFCDLAHRDECGIYCIPTDTGGYCDPQAGFCVAPGGICGRGAQEQCCPGMTCSSGKCLLPTKSKKGNADVITADAKSCINPGEQCCIPKEGYCSLDNLTTNIRANFGANADEAAKICRRESVWSNLNIVNDGCLPYSDAKYNKAEHTNEYSVGLYQLNLLANPSFDYYNTVGTAMSVYTNRHTCKEAFILTDSPDVKAVVEAEEGNISTACPDLKIDSTAHFKCLADKFLARASSEIQAYVAGDLRCQKYKDVDNERYYKCITTPYCNIIDEDIKNSTFNLCVGWFSDPGNNVDYANYLSGGGQSWRPWWTPTITCGIDYFKGNK